MWHAKNATHDIKHKTQATVKLRLHDRYSSYDTADTLAMQGDIRRNILTTDENDLSSVWLDRLWTGASRRP